MTSWDHRRRDWWSAGRNRLPGGAALSDIRVVAGRILAVIPVLGRRVWRAVAIRVRKIAAPIFKIWAGNHSCPKARPAKAAEAATKPAEAAAVETSSREPARPKSAKPAAVKTTAMKA